MILIFYTLLALYYKSIHKSFFSGRIFIKRKSPSAKAKGLEMSGSPDRTIFELFA